MYKGLGALPSRAGGAGGAVFPIESSLSRESPRLPGLRVRPDSCRHGPGLPLVFIEVLLCSVPFRGRSAVAVAPPLPLRFKVVTAHDVASIRESPTMPLRLHEERPQVRIHCQALVAASLIVGHQPIRTCQQAVGVQLSHEYLEPAAAHAVHMGASEAVVAQEVGPGDGVQPLRAIRPQD